MAVQYYNIKQKTDTLFTAYVNEYELFARLYSERLNETRDYGNGEKIKAVQVQTLAMIERHPGTTVSDLADLLNRTKGTVSLNIKELEKKGYILRETREGNSKNKHLYATPKGVKLSTLYNSYIMKSLTEVKTELLKNCSREELNSFSKVLHEWLKLIKSKE